MSAEAFVAAIKSGNAAEALQLFAADSSLADAHDTTGVTALMWAVYMGQAPLVEEMRQQRDLLDIFEASAVGDLSRVDELLTDDAIIVNATSPDGFTPLHLACYFNEPEIVELLLGKGADVHAVAKNPTLVQPLHSAVAGQNVTAVRLLLAHGADPNAQQQNGYRPLDAALEDKNVAIEEMLRVAGAVGSVR